MIRVTDILSGLKSRVGRRLIIHILLFSLVASFGGAALELYWTFTQEIESIHDEFGQIESSYVPSIIDTLWVTDDEALRMQAEGILALPHMQFIEIRKGAEVLEAVGTPQTAAILEHTAPLIKVYNGQDVHLGELHVVASLKGVYAGLWGRGVKILILQLVGALLLSLFIFIIFHQLVGRHIANMAAFVESMRFESMEQDLHLNRRRARRRPDELDQLATAFNRLRGNLGSHITELERAIEIRNLAVDSAELGLWDWNVETGEVMYDERWVGMLGYAVGELSPNVGTWERLLHPEDKARVMAEVKSCFDNTAPIYRTEFRLRAKSGQWNWVMACGKVIERDDQGAPVRMLGVHLDINANKQMDEELGKHRDHLEELVQRRTTQLDARVSEAETLNSAMVNVMEDLDASNRSLEIAGRNLTESNKELDAFSYSVSHDLRAPLRHVDGFVRLLLKREEGSLDSTSSHYLSAIAASSNRMGELIDDLLAFSRIGRKEMRCRRVNSNDIIQKALEALSPLTEGRRVTWNIAELPSVDADGGLLRLVWENLIGNALKYTGSRQEAHIEIGFTHEESGEAAGAITFFIADNGVGFDPQYKHKLFGAFQRLHRAEEFEGTGIGLATVRRIINRHGGQIWAEGEVNHGATFYFTLDEASGGA